MEPLVWFLLLPLIVLLLLMPSQRKNLPPGPYPWPIISNMLSLLSSTPHVDLMKLARTYGPLMLIKYDAQPVIVTSTLAAAMEILKTNDRILSGRLIPHSLRIKNHIKHSVVSDNCIDNWKALRRIARTELFSTKMLEANGQVREKKVAKMVSFVCGQDGKKVMITEFVFGTILNILGNVVFSKDVFEYGEKGDKVGMQKLIRDMLMITVTPNISDFFPILGRFDLQGLLRACEARFNDVIGLWEGAVKERGEKNDHTKHDFLEVLLANGFDDAQINAMFLETLGPGSETTSTTIEWAMAEPLKNQEKMAELDRLVGSGTLTESHLPRLHYLQACIKESMRLHPVTPFLIPHCGTESCKVMGYTIPKDCQIIVNAYAIGRDPEAWKDPNAFIPERFLESDLDYYGNHFHFIPFGAGRRICMGLPLASRILPLILGSLIHAFDWCLPDGMSPAKLDLKEKISLTLVTDPSLVAVPKVRA